MSADLDTVQSAIAANLTAIAGIQVSPYMLSSPTPPNAHVVPSEIDYHGALNDGLETLLFNVQLFVGTTTDIGAQKTLNGYLGKGAGSVKAAIEADPKLTSRLNDDGSVTSGQSPACDDLIVLKASGYRVYKSNDGLGEVIGADWLVKVIV